jgi:hypothetical protein
MENTAFLLAARSLSKAPVCLSTVFHKVTLKLMVNVVDLFCKVVMLNFLLHIYYFFFSILDAQSEKQQ